MTITFNNLRPETLQALVNDPGLPKELWPQLNNLLAQHGDNAFMASCDELADEMKANNADGPKQRGANARPIAASFGSSVPSDSFVRSCEQYARSM